MMFLIFLKSKAVICRYKLESKELCKRVFAGVIKVMDFEIRRLFGIIKVSLF